MMRIVIDTIPHVEQRYETVGDWYYTEDGGLVIAISEMGDWRMESLMAIHELVEGLLCKEHGVTQKQVDDFDMEFEDLREPGDCSEAGDHPRAPYRREHCIATGIERILAVELGLDWEDYDRVVNAL